MSMWRSMGLFVAGLFHGVVAFQVAMIFGGALGHGTDYMAQLTVAPFGRSEAAFIAGLLVWGLSFAAAGNRRPAARGLLVAWLGVHYLSLVVSLLGGIPPRSGSLLLLLPYALGQVFLWVLFVKVGSAAEGGHS